MGIMRKIERMSIAKKRKVLMQLANRQKNEKLKNELKEMNDEDINKCFIEILEKFTKKGSAYNV